MAQTEQAEGHARDGFIAKAKKAWASTGIDRPTLFSMVKFALPPTIALSIYQANTIAYTFTSVGYLIAIASILSGALMPRALFIQNIIVNILTISFTTAAAILAMWSVVQARVHTTPPGGSTSAYNSSASAVAAVWLFFLIYVINSLKSAYPQFKLAGVLSSILASVSMSYAPQNPDMTTVLSLARRIWGAFLLGMAISTGVSLCVKPTSCRQVIFGDFTRCLTGVQNVLKTQLTYMESLEEHNMFQPSKEADALRGAINALRAAHAKTFADIPAMKKEIAYGRFAGPQLAEVHRLIRRAFLPVTGVGTIIDFFERIARIRGWQYAVLDESEGDIVPESERATMIKYQSMMKMLHEPFTQIAHAMRDACEHVMLVLRLKKERKIRATSKLTNGDVEAKGEIAQPGDRGFADHLEGAIGRFHKSRESIFRSWCILNNVPIVGATSEARFHWPRDDETNPSGHRQRQLLVLLYMENLMYTASKALLELVRYADTLRDKPRHFILPGRKHMMKWVRSFAIRNEHPDDDEHESLNESVSTGQMRFGQAFAEAKDPERLPPSNAFQRAGSVFRKTGNLLRSSHSIFGFRIACAILSIGIMAYVRQTQTFFVEQRIFWAEIMVAVSMTRTSGQASFIYFLRILGTILGAVCCYIVFYIVDEKAPGALVFFFLFVTAIAYINVKKPKLVLVGMIASVTLTIVIGYELQVMKIGVIIATANSQLYYPLYLLAPYRLGATAAGLAVAFIWTILPFPISDTSELRRSVGLSLYLEAKHYAAVQETVAAQLRGDQGDMSDKRSPGRRLEKERTRLMSKQMMLVQNMQGQSNFTRWQLPIDGAFPKATYDAIVARIHSIANYASLIAYASSAFAVTGSDESQLQWRRDFARILQSVEETSNDIPAVLCLLSSSILSAQPLPPHLKLPKPYQLLKYMQELDEDILSIEHITEPGYAGFAVMQIASRSITSDLHALAQHIKELVGELDFSYRYVAGGAHASDNSKGKQA